MDAEKFGKYVEVLNILAKFKKEEDIIDECHNKSVDHDNVQVYIGPLTFVNIN